MRLQSKDGKVLISYELKDQQQRDSWIHQVNLTIDQIRGTAKILEGSTNTASLRTQSLTGSLLQTTNLDKSSYLNILKQDVIDDDDEYSDESQEEEKKVE